MYEKLISFIDLRSKSIECYSIFKQSKWKKLSEDCCFVKLIELSQSVFTQYARKIGLDAYLPELRSIKLNDRLEIDSNRLSLRFMKTGMAYPREEGCTRRFLST